MTWQLTFAVHKEAFDEKGLKDGCFKVCAPSVSYGFLSDVCICDVILSGSHRFAYIADVFFC